MLFRSPTLKKNIRQHWQSSTKVGILPFFFRVGPHTPVTQPVDNEFQAIKAESKASLEESRTIMNEIEPGLRDEYQHIEAARAYYDKALASAEQNGTTPPSSEGVDIRTVDELQAELGKQQANLELNFATDGGVVEQYEKRKRQVWRSQFSLVADETMTLIRSRNLRKRLQNCRRKSKRLKETSSMPESVLFNLAA